MKPTVIANANASASAGSGPGNASNGITIPINHDYVGGVGHSQSPQQQSQQHPQYYTQGQHYVGGGDPHSTAYGSPGSHARVQHQQQQQPHPQQQQQQIPAHFQQDFDFDSDMFPRSRLGRMAHDPFADFGASRKRSSLHDPQFHSDVFSRYFDDEPDFGFPQFNSLGRRRVNNPHHDDDFFNRLPSEFRQYIPEGFGHRRTVPTATMPGSPGAQAQQMPQQMPQHFYQTMPQSPTKKVCDAAIQTEDPNGSGRSEVDHAVHPENLNQHGLRNTMDMGVKSATENEDAGFRSHSAPPPEQQQQYHPQQHIPVNGKRPTPPPTQQHQQGARPQFGTQTSPQVQSGGYAGQAPQFHKAYYAPQQSSHPQQKQQTPPPPQTPGGTYIRTIPIFVEGRSEPIINNKEIPNQNAPPTAATGRAFTPPRQQQQQPSQQQQPQQHRPTPLNTQNQEPQQAGDGLPPQTPHTVDSINKIQDIQRDVLALMTCVEQFTGTRADKQYAYLDEMLTRNLLKLDNIDTNGKESIRLARKEAIKCIQASINVLEAKAEENTRAAQGGTNATAMESTDTAAEPTAEETPQKSSSGAKVTKDASQTRMEAEEEPADVTKIQEPIPLPPPEGMMVDNKAAEVTAMETAAAADTTQAVTEKEPSPSVTEKAAEETKPIDAATTEVAASNTETK